MIFSLSSFACRVEVVGTEGGVQVSGTVDIKKWKELDKVGGDG